MSNSDSNRTIYVTAIISLFSLGVPLLYLVGYLALEGYLGEYGLNIKAFPVPWERVLVTSYKILLDGLLTRWLRLMSQADMLLVVLAGLILVLLVTAHITINQQSNSQEKKESFGQKAIKSTWFAYIAAPFFLIISFSLLIFIFGLFLAIGFFIASAHTAGQEHARSQMENFTPCYSQNSSCVFIFKNNEKIVEGSLVTMSDRYTAVYDGERTHLIPNNNLRMEAEPK